MPEVRDDPLARHIVALRRYARVLMGNTPEADDLVQECLARALARVRFWREIRDVRTYLFAIMHNLFVDELARRRRQRRHVSIEDVEDSLMSCSPNQGVAMEVLDMYRGLQQLPDKQRETLMLVGMDGLSYREVAGVTGVPIGTVMSRLSRARESLRHYMNGGSRAQQLRKMPNG